MFRRLVLGLPIAILAGCASIPEPIQVAENTPLVSYQQVASQPEQSQGQTVRWGGIVANVENQKDRTLVEMVHYPLRDYGRPLVNDESIGRFRVYVNGFLDPVVYQQGRAVTFVGSATGVELGMVGEHEYVFPVMDASGYHIWKEVQRIDITTSHHYWPHSWWGIGWPYTTRSTVIIRGNRDTSSGGTTSSSSSSRPSKPAQPSRPKPAFRKSTGRDESGRQ